LTKELILSGYYLVISIFTAFVFTKIKANELSIYNSFFISFLYAVGGFILLKYSDLSLVKQSAMITLISRFGYLIGLSFMGEQIALMQWCGIAIMTFGSFLTNK
jgi:hypothetical protein